MSKDIKVIAFYLPQFHTIPENDKAHGEGFTEWHNTRKAIPLFEGHYQPKIPFENNYYCILNEGVMEEQAKLAKEYGVFGFCYYHYWFRGGKKLLEKPLEMMLHNPKIDIPFCLCWANENWTKRWDGGNNEVIVEQDYDDYADLDVHIDYLCQFFKDPRYIKDEGKPVLLIYKPELIPNLSKYVERIRNRIVQNGFAGVKLVVQYPKYFFNGTNLKLFDNYIQFQPRFIQDYINEKERSKIKVVIKKIMLSLEMKRTVDRISKILINKRGCLSELTHRDYDNDWQEIVEYKVVDDKMIAGAFTDWDNTARNKNGLVYDGASPEKFEYYMKRLVEKVEKEYKEPYIFINAWNEWAEGAYLEADQKYEYAYLKALKKAVKNT